MPQATTFLIHLLRFLNRNSRGVYMSLINKETIKSFLGGRSFLTGVEDAEGHEFAVSQAENIVYQKTLIPIPDKIEDAIPTLEFCAHCIYIFIVSTRQNLKEEEIKRRKELYDSGMKILNDIQSGDLPIYDTSGSVVSTTKQDALFQVGNCNRSERL
jgi:hypothetical protein